MGYRTVGVLKMFLSDLRRIAELFALRETACRSCPAEDWAPTCSACGGSMRVWVGREWMLSDEQLAQLRRERPFESNVSEGGSAAPDLREG